MIAKECKRLIEVDFPIAEVSRHSAREKSIRHGHPSTLHLWWARRPLAACRAVLMGLLLPDPCDPNCPKEFKEKARRAVAGITEPPKGDEELRRALLKFIADFANWDNSSDANYIHTARSLVKAAHGEEPPLVVDPFAGGGSIPLEALRVGCDAFASDLNPVACLILKVMLEDIPRHGPELAEELRRVGAEIKAKAEEELAEFYPPDPDGARPIAYLWARTVQCEAPNCGAEIPLARSFWLSKKAERRCALRWKVERPKKGPPEIEFEVFEPKAEKDVPGGTVTRAKATCPTCRSVLPPDRVRAQLAARRGGADVLFDSRGQRVGGARLLAVVTLKEREVGRRYRLPTERDYEAVWRAQKRLEKVVKEKLPNGLSAVPDEPTPAGGGSGAGRAFSVQKYGMLQWGDLFTARQKLAMITFAKQIRQCQDWGESLAIILSKMSDLENALCAWRASSECVDHLFARQAIPIVWDFAEASPMAGATGSWESMLNRSVEGSLSSLIQGGIGQVQISDVCESPLPDDAATVWFTDPPYYDAVPYADLSDFFFVWLKRALPGHPLLRDPFDSANPLVHKAREAVQNERSEAADGQPKDRAFYEEAMARAFAEGRRVLREDGVGAVVFAHKTTEGWEALLSGMIRGGWTITGSWPIATEMGSRLRARESAALATSIHLVCRPRTTDETGDWAEVLRELPKRVGDWMERLQNEGVRGADLIFACIGPALEIFSRFSRVETAEGREVTLAEYLEKVFETVSRTALGQILGTAEARARNSQVGALEEDARLTALFLWTLQSASPKASDANGEDGEEDEEGDEEEEGGAKKKKRGHSLPFDIVRRFAQPLGIHLDAWEGRVIETEKGVVRLLPVAERAKQLFGKEGTEGAAEAVARRRWVQLKLFPEAEEAEAPKKAGRGRKKARIAEEEEEAPARHETTTLDRLHAAMLFQAGGQAAALRELITQETARGPEFLRLANALSALYPMESEEKRLIDAMLLGVPRG